MKIYNLHKPLRRLVMLHANGHSIVMPPSGTSLMNDVSQVRIFGAVARHQEFDPMALAIVKLITPVDARLTIEGMAGSQQINVTAQVSNISANSFLHG